MATKTTTIPLPNKILETDLAYPKNAKRYNAKTYISVEQRLTLHYTERFGWCVATLTIARATGRRSGMQDRTYALSLKGEGVVRVGLGPHVLRTITVYVHRKNKERLQWLLDLHNTGEAKAGDIRDRISTRRAQGALRRSAFGGFGAGRW